jgi:hypothetical protein
MGLSYNECLTFLLRTSFCDHSVGAELYSSVETSRKKIKYMFNDVIKRIAYVSCGRILHNRLSLT